MKKLFYIISIMAFLAVFSSCRTADPIATETSTETSINTATEMPDETKSDLPTEIEHVFGKYYSDKQASATIGSGCSIDTNQFVVSASTRCYDGKVYYFGKYKEVERFPGFPDDLVTVYSLMAYDLKTGESYPVCKDAACSHLDSGCPFYIGYSPRSCNEVIVDENGVLYITLQDKNEKSSYTSGLYSYDLRTGILTKIGNREMKSSFSMRKVGEWLYYTDLEYHKDDNGYDMYYMRYSDKTHKTEKLFMYMTDGDYTDFGLLNLIKEDGTMYVVPTDHVVDNIAPVGYLCETNIEKYNDRRQLTDFFDTYAMAYFYGDNVYVVFIDKELSKANYNYIWKIDTKTGEQKIIAKGVYKYAYQAGKYMYYFPYKSERVPVEGFEKPMVSYSRGEIIRIDLETEERESIKIPDTFCFWSNSYETFFYNGRIFGNALLYSPELIKNGETMGYIELDITTGDVRRVPSNVCWGY